MGTCKWLCKIAILPTLMLLKLHTPMQFTQLLFPNRRDTRGREGHCKLLVSSRHSLEDLQDTEKCIFVTDQQEQGTAPTKTDSTGANHIKQVRLQRPNDGINHIGHTEPQRVNKQDLHAPMVLRHSGHGSTTHHSRKATPATYLPSQLPNPCSSRCLSFRDYVPHNRQRYPTQTATILRH